MLMIYILKSAKRLPVLKRPWLFYGTFNDSFSWFPLITEPLIIRVSLLGGSCYINSGKLIPSKVAGVNRCKNRACCFQQLSPYVINWNLGSSSVISLENTNLLSMMSYHARLFRWRQVSFSSATVKNWKTQGNPWRKNIRLFDCFSYFSLCVFSFIAIKLQ